MRRWRTWGACAATILLSAACAESRTTIRAAPRSIAVELPDGTMVASRPVPAGGSFALAYEHSAYRAPAVEIFVVRGGRFTMEAVASPNEAVLDYYAVPGRRVRTSGWWLLRPEAPQRFGELPLIATPVGRRTLVAGGSCTPLYPPSGAYDLRIRIERRRPAGRTVACPPVVAGLVGAVGQGP
jgi:hypothetical protein